MQIYHYFRATELFYDRGELISSRALIRIIIKKISSTKLYGYSSPLQLIFENKCTFNNKNIASFQIHLENFLFCFVVELPYKIKIISCWIDIIAKFFLWLFTSLLEKNQQFLFCWFWLCERVPLSIWSKFENPLRSIHWHWLFRSIVYNSNGRWWVCPWHWSWTRWARIEIKLLKKPIYKTHSAFYTLVTVQWDGISSTAKFLCNTTSVKRDSIYERNFDTAKVDPTGRLYTSTFTNDLCAPSSNQKGSLYLFEKNKNVKTLSSNVKAITGLAFNKKNKLFYCIDPCTNYISEYDWSPRSGNIRKNFIALLNYLLNIQCIFILIQFL